MPGFIDASCPKCHKKIGWFGVMTDHPGCACGYRPPQEELQATEDKMNETIRLMSLKPKDAKRSELRGKRNLAGLTLMQAAKISGIAALRISSFERGEERPTEEESKILGEIYECGNEEQDQGTQTQSGENAGA